MLPADSEALRAPHSGSDTELWRVHRHANGALVNLVGGLFSAINHPFKESRRNQTKDGSRTEADEHHYRLAARRPTEVGRGYNSHTNNSHLPHTCLTNFTKFIQTVAAVGGFSEQRVSRVSR